MQLTLFAALPRVAKHSNKMMDTWHVERWKMVETSDYLSRLIWLLENPLLVVPCSTPKKPFQKDSSWVAFEDDEKGSGQKPVAVIPDLPGAPNNRAQNKAVFPKSLISDGQLHRFLIVLGAFKLIQTHGNFVLVQLESCKRIKVLMEQF